MADKRTRIVILIVLLAAASLGVQAGKSYRLGLLQKPPDWTKVPYTFAEWSGRDEQFDKIYGENPADTELLRSFQGKDGKHIIVYVGYYKELAAVMELHGPEICYPSQGWSIGSIGESETGTFRGKSIRARTMLAKMNDQGRRVMWWYNAGTKPFEDRLRYVYVSLAMEALHGRTDGSLVRLEAPLEGGDDEAAATKRLTRFRNDFLPFLEHALSE
jgi:EpsI family protein